MRITKELRELAADPLLGYVSQEVHAEVLTAIADRIDAEHKKALAEQFKALTTDMELMTDEEMAAHGWVRLPKDADGEYIRIGDVLTDDAEFKSEGKVMRLMLEDEGWMVGIGCGGWTSPSIHEWHHYHGPTVEDVLREFAMAVCKDDALTIRKNVLDEYASKFRLADDGKRQ